MNYFGNVFGRSSLFEQHDMEIMKADIYQKENNNYISVDLPGFQKENITVDYQNGYLNITASKEDIEEHNYFRRERYYGEMSRSFYIGDIDENKIEATFQNGELTISYPLEEESPREKKIQIQ